MEEKVTVEYKLPKEVVKLENVNVHIGEHMIRIYEENKKTIVPMRNVIRIYEEVNQ